MYNIIYFHKNCSSLQAFPQLASSLSLLNPSRFPPLPERGEEEGKGCALVKTYGKTHLT